MKPLHVLSLIAAFSITGAGIVYGTQGVGVSLLALAALGVISSPIWMHYFDE